MAKKGRISYTRHHRKCKSHSGSDDYENISLVEDWKHKAYHALFKNGTPEDVARILNDTWIDSEYELVVKKRPPKPDPNQKELFV